MTGLAYRPLPFLSTVYPETMPSTSSQSVDGYIDHTRDLLLERVHGIKTHLGRRLTGGRISCPITMFSDTEPVGRFIGRVHCGLTSRSALGDGGQYTGRSGSDQRLGRIDIGVIGGEVCRIDGRGLGEHVIRKPLPVTDRVLCALECQCITYGCSDDAVGSLGFGSQLCTVGYKWPRSC